MAKIILSTGETVLREVALSKERITIGRRLHNDIVIDDLAVSGEHAVIVTSGADAYLEDFNSTNGTKVNGQPVRKHFLQNQDVVDLALYRMTYLADAPAEIESERPADDSASIPPVGIGNVGRIKILNGSDAGREARLFKSITTIGRPDTGMAIIIQHPHGYALAQVDGHSCPTVNGELIGAGAYRLKHGDVVDLTAGRLQFLSR